MRAELLQLLVVVLPVALTFYVVRKLLGGRRRARSELDPQASAGSAEPAAAPLPLDGVLDLHTFAPRDVGSLVPAWIDACREQGLRELRIVHGKGRGSLRRSVHAILARRADVLSYRLAPSERGGWGATLVTLRDA